MIPECNQLSTYKRPIIGVHFFNKRTVHKPLQHSVRGISDNGNVHLDKSSLIPFRLVFETEIKILRNPSCFETQRGKHQTIRSIIAKKLTVVNSHFLLKSQRDISVTRSSSRRQKGGKEISDTCYWKFAQTQYPISNVRL